MTKVFVDRPAKPDLLVVVGNTKGMYQFFFNEIIKHCHLLSQESDIEPCSKT